MKQLEQAYIMRPNAHEVVLEYLNIRDITTMVPKLRRFKFLDALSLHANNLTFIPSLQILDQLRDLNLSRNPIKIDNKLMDSLFTIPNLQALSIDIHSQDQRQMIIQNLPRLKYLNGALIQRKKQVRAPKQQQMKKIKQKLAAQQQNVKSLLYTMYRSLDQSGQPPDINQQVTFSIKCIIQEFQYFYQNITSQLARSCVYLYYKHKMYQILETHLTSYLEDHDHQNIANAIDEMNKPKRQGFEEILKVILQYAYEEDFSNKTIQPGNKLRKETLYQNEITRLKKQVADLTKQNQQLHQVNEKYLERVYQGKENIRVNEENGLKMSRTSRNKSNLPTPTSRRDQTPMSKSNSKKQFTRTPSKQMIKQEFSKTPQVNNRTQEMKRTPRQSYLAPSYSKKDIKPYRELDKSPSYQVLPRHHQDEPYEQPVFNKTNSLGSFSTRKLKPNFSSKPTHSPYQRQHHQSLKRTSSKTTINHEKKLTLDQVVQFIDEFIYQKGKFNLRSNDKGELYQTPQEFLYTYFLRKYGLKDMALQWSLLIIKAIQKYSKENIIVEVFGKILKNNVEEQFYAKCKQFKEYFNPLVPLKDAFTAGDVRQCFFEAFPHDQNQAFQKLISKLQGQTIKSQKIYKRRTVLFALEAYFVKNHQKDIAKFLDHFKMHDRDDDGILQNDEIDRCISTFIQKYADLLHIYQSEENMDSLFKEIMGKRRKKGNMVSMTFSQFVAIMRDCF